MKTKKNFLKKLAAVTLGFVMTLGVGAAGYAGAASEAKATEHSVTITRSCFPSGSLAYNKTDNWTATGTDGTSISGEGDLYSSASQTTMQTKNSSVSTMYHNTTAMPGPITKIELKCASGTTRTYTAYMNKTTAITSTSGGTSKGTIAPTAGNSASLTLQASDGWKYFWLNLAGGASFLDYIKVYYDVSEAKTLSSIAVSSNHRTFTVGDTFVKETVTATYSDSSTADVTNSATFSSPDMSTAGSKAINVSYTEGGTTKSTSYNINVTAPRELLSISVSGTPTKTTYYVGDDFDPAGLVVTGTYDIGDPEPITEGIEFVSEPETFTSTSQTSVEVLASYGDFTSEPYPVNGLTVQEKPKEFVATFAEGLSNSNSTEATDATLKSNFGYSIDTNLTFEDISKLYGQQDQALKFGAGKNAGSFSISIPSTYQGKSIHIASVLLKAAYYGTDETTFSVEGNNVELTSSLAEYTVNFTAGNLTKINFSTIAGKRVYFSEIKVRYDVNKSLSSISVSNNHRSFDLDTTFVPETVTATYSDGSSSEVTPTSITSPDMSTLGNQTISVSYTDSYGSASTSYTINVHYATVTSVTVSPDTYSLGVSGTLDLTTIDVTILPENADQSTFGWTIDPDSKNPSTMDCSLSGTTFSAGNVPGTVDLICTAGDESDKLTVTISAGALISLDKTEVEGIANISSDVEVNATIYNYQSVTSITWTSNHEDVASVSGTSVKGTIKFLHEGSATVTCTAVVVNLLGVSETVSETVSVTVTKQLSSISASLIDSTKSYPENTNVPASDLSVTATYSDGQNAAASGFTVTEPLVSMSDNSIKVSYTEGGITVTTNVTVTVVKATLKSLSFTNKTLDQFKQDDATHGTFSLGSNAAITAIYNTSFADESVVVNGVKKSPLKGVLRFELCSRSGTSSYTYTKATDIELGDPMLRSYNGLYLLAYYKYGESEVRADAALVTVAAPEIKVEVSETLPKSWTKVTDASQFEANKEYVIAASGSDYAMSTTQNTNNRGQAAITKSDSTITWDTTAGVQVFTLKAGTKNNSWAFYDGAGYIYAASSSSNYLKTETTLSDNSSFVISVTSAGVATATAQGSNSHKIIKYNSGSSIFSCYTGGMQDISIYKHVGGETTTPYVISDELYDAIAALPSPLTSDNWSSLSSLSSFVESGKEGTNDYKALKLGKAKTDGNMAEQFLATYDSICGPQELTNYLGRTTLTPHRTIAYGNVDGATLTGGTIAGSYEKGSTINLPTASKTGYNNATWWTLDGTSTGNWGSQVTTSFSLENNTTLYAKWTPIAYTITYELDGGTNHDDNPSTYTIEDAITLKAPSKAGCEFSAWSNGGVIEKGSTGDKTFTASWNPLPQNISFNGTHVTSSGASTCLFGAQYNATFTAEENYNLPGSITVKLNGEDYSNYSYSSVDGSFSIASMPAGTISISVTAQEGNTYTISYAEVDGTPITEAGLVYEYEFGTGATLVDAQDRLGFNFGGWYNEPELQNKVESIGATEKGHRKFYAKWEFGAQDALNNVESSIGMSFTYQKDAETPIVSQSEPTTKAETKAAQPLPTSVNTFKSKWTSTKNFSDIDSDTFKEVLQCSGEQVITGVKSSSFTNAYIGGNGGSGSSQWNIWNSLKIGKSSAQGTITLTLDSSKQFSSIKVKAIGNRNDGTLTINGVTKSVTKQASKSDLTPIELEYDIKGGISELTFASKDASSSNYSIMITQIEFVFEAPERNLDHIAIEGTPTKTAYNVGEAYSTEGLHVEAYYDDESHESVTATITPSKQYAEAGDTSVTFSATYEGKTASLPPVNVTVSSVYSSVSFKFNFKNTGMDALVSEYGKVYDDMGLVVVYDGRTRYFSFIHDDKGNYYIYEDGKPATTFKMKDGGMFTLNLGDMINDENNRASIVFTVKAYIRVGETYYYSNNSESYSVKTWIEYYHSQAKYKDATEDLYNIFFPNGK